MPMKMLLNASPPTKIYHSNHNIVAPNDRTFELKFFQQNVVFIWFN